MNPCVDCCCACNLTLGVITLLMSAAAVVLSAAQFFSEKPSRVLVSSKNEERENEMAIYNSHRE